MIVAIDLKLFGIKKMKIKLKIENFFVILIKFVIIDKG